MPGRSGLDECGEECSRCTIRVESPLRVPLYGNGEYFSLFLYTLNEPVLCATRHDRKITTDLCHTLMVAAVYGELVPACNRLNFRPFCDFNRVGIAHFPSRLVIHFGLQVLNK